MLKDALALVHIPTVHIYLHVPFCARRCSYCDFAIAVRRQVPTERYVAAVLREWDAWQANEIWNGDAIQTVYFGGGTPSHIDPAGIADLIDGIGRLRPIAAAAEITLEANPDDVTPARASAWRAAGVNRISRGRACRGLRRAVSRSHFRAALGARPRLGERPGPGVCPRTRAPLTVRSHGRGPHPAGSVGRSGRGDPRRRGSLRLRIPRGRPRARGPGIRADPRHTADGAGAGSGTCGSGMRTSGPSWRAAPRSRAWRT